MKILKNIAIVQLIIYLYDLFLKLEERTSTRIISQKALEDLSNPKKVEQINNSIKFYKENGFWNM